MNSCAPGAPEDVDYTADSGVLKLTTVATSNFVNEGIVLIPASHHGRRPGNYITACAVGITPPLANRRLRQHCQLNNLNPIPVADSDAFDLAGLPTYLADGAHRFSQGPLNTGGNFFASATNFFNTFQGQGPDFLEPRQARDSRRR